MPWPALSRSARSVPPLEWVARPVIPPEGRPQRGIPVAQDPQRTARDASRCAATSLERWCVSLLANDEVGILYRLERRWSRTSD